MGYSEKFSSPPDARGNKGGVRLSKHRGQHLLADPCVVDKIIAAAELRGEDFVLEVGPGMGALTGKLAEGAGKLVAVELDPLFVRELKEKFQEKGNVEIIEGDILKMRISDVIARSVATKQSPRDRVADARDDGIRYKVVTNLPYNITSAFLKKFLTEPPFAERIVIMIQKEVADRITHADNEERGMLGIMCNLYAECSSVCKVPASAFNPPPKVDSAVIMLKPYAEKEFAERWGFGRAEAEAFLGFVGRFFSQPRKKMAGLLPKPQAEKLRQTLLLIGENSDSRPAVLSLDKWAGLWKMVK